MLKHSLCAAVTALASIPLAYEFASQTPAPATAQGIRFDGTVIAAVQVKDIEAAKRWYAEVLGATVHFEVADHSWCELTTPAANAFIGLGGTAEAKSSGGATFSLGVKDMIKARDFLVAHKVKLDGEIVEIPKTVKLLSFFDPDGNKLMFYEPFTGQ